MERIETNPVEEATDEAILPASSHEDMAECHEGAECKGTPQDSLKRVSFNDELELNDVDGSMTMPDLEEDKELQVIDVGQPSPNNNDDDNYTPTPDGFTKDPSYKRTNRRTGLCSNELRKEVVEGLMLGTNEFQDSIGKTDERSSVTTNSRDGSQGRMWSCFHRFFLNTSYPLRRQMMLSFGMVGGLSIVMVMIVAIVAAVATGEAIKRTSSENVDVWVEGFMRGTGRLVAETLSSKIMPTDLVDLMIEIGRDRFSGYPYAEDDSQTPFFDTLSQTNVYPLKNTPLPMDWDFRHTPNEMGNVNNDTHVEHVQDRFPLYATIPRLSTAMATYIMQGACDPRVTDPDSMVYYPNCTEANNNVTTGGVVNPTATSEQVYRKSADLSPSLKALYEYHQDIMSLGYYFGNSGAGGTIFFPHYELDSSSSYVSVGCDWMRTDNPINPSLGPIGTDEEISRCHPEGTVVSSREYNPMERGWCRDEALNPNRSHSFGPYISAFDGRTWFMSVGRSFYDHSTGNFIACTLVDFLLNDAEQLLEDVKIDELGLLTLVRADDVGTIVISPYFDFATANDTTTIDDPAMQVGVNQSTYAQIMSIVDFSVQWNPEEAVESYEGTIFETEENLVTAYPIPPIPETYDPNYKPEFFAIFTVSKNDGLPAINEQLNEEVDDGVWNCVLWVIIIGTSGLAIVFILILTTSSWFVRPLRWMGKVGKQVLGGFGRDNVDGGINFQRKRQLCTPKTELNSLVEEFEKTVAHFSGEGTARKSQINDSEKFNTFEFAEDYASLYKSRQDESFQFKYHNESLSKRESLKHFYHGRNTLGRRSDLLSELSSFETKNTKHNIYKSPFFRWIVGMIATPILITSIVISAVVLSKISLQLPTLTEPVKEEYLEIKESYRMSTTGLLSVHASIVVSKAVRDTHLLSRLANWIFFGGMNVSDSFSDVIQGAEECKTAEDPSACNASVVCDCAWNDINSRGGKSCSNYGVVGESRAYQKVYFEAQRHDTDENGSRNSTSFPDVDYSPDTTAWWDGIQALPQNDLTSTRYGTTYDRVKMVSALSTVFMPLYNYDRSSDRPWGSYVGFEADGMFAGYSGCDATFLGFPFFRSSEENGASVLRPELCPLGKYGYDARCRSWYDQGKQKSLSGNGTLHISPPYVFVTDGEEIIGISTSSPIMEGEEYIGQVIIDLIPGAIFRSLSRESTSPVHGAFPVMITPVSDALGHDVVVGPEFSLEGDGMALHDLLHPDKSFDNVYAEMKAGFRGSASFVGGQDKVNMNISMNISYAPVYVRNFFSMNSSDISRGVSSETTLVYSLALIESEIGAMQSFQTIHDLTAKTVSICIGILSILIILSAVLIFRLAMHVASYMTESILELLDVLKDINRMCVSQDEIATKLKHIKGSCREVHNLRLTTEMLYTVVQYANVAFFSGDLTRAYKVLQDALRLFTRLENKKAIAVACNNLGNTMLTIYRTMTADGEKELCGMSKEMVVEKGTMYFAQSLKLGEEAYDKFYNEQGWSEECLAFMQHLANRYFNRAIFLLTTSNNHEDSNQAVALGFRDLQIVNDMDVEIVDQCAEMGFTINSGERFELMISRIRGLLALFELGFSPDELYIEDQITDLYNYFRTAMKNPSHDLFKEVSIAGRMQKLDVELIKYLRDVKKDNSNAAKVAIRMLVEDEYLYDSAEIEATKMLLMYKDTDGSSEMCPLDDAIYDELTLTKEHLEKEFEQKFSTRMSLESSASASQLYSMNSVEEDADMVMRRNSSACRSTTLGDVTMETF